MSYIPRTSESLYGSSDALGDVLNGALEHAKALASAVPSAELRDRESAVESLRTKVRIAPLVVRVDQAKTATIPEDVMVRRACMPQNRSGANVMQPGLGVVVMVPYSGNSMLLEHEASRHQELDATTRLLDGKIEFSKTFTLPTTTESIREWRRNTLAAIKANADAANAQVSVHNEKVSAVLPDLPERRQAGLDALRKIAEELD